MTSRATCTQKIQATLWQEKDGLWYACVEVDRTPWITSHGSGTRRSIYKTIHRFVNALGVSVKELVINDVK